MISVRSALVSDTVGAAMTPGILRCLPSTHRVHVIVVFGNDDSTLDIARAFSSERGDSSSG